MIHESSGPDETSAGQSWPVLPLEEWKDTYATLHMWLQLVGKIRLALAPMVNHWWQATAYVSSRGLTTSAIPYRTGSFEIEFDFIDHQLIIRSSEGGERRVALRPRSVSDFYREVCSELGSLGIHATIWTMPQEVADPIPFELDDVHASYDPEYVHRLWRILLNTERVMSRFRSRFLGKCSPVQLYWGAFDIAVTRFSGRSAPEHPGGIPMLSDRVTREAYSHEVISCGFWPGGAPVLEPAFYAYAYPEPEGFGAWSIAVEGAYYHPELREYVLPYEAVRNAADPEAHLLSFFQQTYEAGADLGKWDRPALERPSTKLV